MLVDDDPLMHRLYQPHIERAGYEMVGAMDGGEAVQLARREPPLVVVMDMMMPEVDGLAAMLALKKAQTTKDIPVILISANPQCYGYQRQFEAVGAEAFLSKPFSPARLLAEIRRLDPQANLRPG